MHPPPELPSIHRRRGPKLPQVGKPQSTLVLRVEALVICALSLSVAGIVLARVGSTPTWHDVAFPPTHGASTLPKVATLSNAAPGWVVIVLVVGLAALWAACGWMALRHKETAALG